MNKQNFHEVRFPTVCYAPVSFVCRFPLLGPNSSPAGDARQVGERRKARRATPQDKCLSPYSLFYGKVCRGKHPPAIRPLRFGFDPLRSSGRRGENEGDSECWLLPLRLPNDLCVPRIQASGGEADGNRRIHACCGPKTCDFGAGGSPGLVFQGSLGHEPCQTSQCSRLVYDHKLLTQVKTVAPPIIYLVWLIRAV